MTMIIAFRHGEAVQSTQEVTLTEDFLSTISQTVPISDKIKTEMINQKCKGIITGGSGESSKNDPLTEKGIEQARILGEKLWQLYPDLTEIHSSDLTRCMQTAQEVQKVFENHGKILKIISNEEFQEIRHGSMDGVIPATLRNRIYKDYHDQLIQEAENEGKEIDPAIKHKENPPGFDGETFEQAGLRGEKAFIELANQSPTTPKVVITSNAILKGVILSTLYSDPTYAEKHKIKPLFYEKIPGLDDVGYIAHTTGYKFEVVNQTVKYAGPVN